MESEKLLLEMANTVILEKEFDDDKTQSSKIGYIFAKEIKEILKDLNKLERLEQIEEEIGLDLETFYRLVIKNDLSTTIYLKDGGIIPNSDIWQGIDEIGRYVRSAYDIVRKYYYKDYGQTWAMSREELKDD